MFSQSRYYSFFLQCCQDIPLKNLVVDSLVALRSVVSYNTQSMAGEITFFFLENSLRAEAARTASDLAKTQARGELQTPSVMAVIITPVSRLTVLAQGSGVALLLPGHNYHLWVGCTCTVCKLEHCPGHSFADVDQFECPENSFQLYRALGPGNIRTGDFVGLYYPNGGTWLAMINGVGQQSKCPGAPTDQDGFSSYSKWNECSDSAFRIYAKGKSSDQTIESGNLISLYYPKNVGKGYVEYLTAGLTTSTCMKDESASLLPPTSAAYDLCQSSTAFLTIYAIEESLYGLN